VQLSAQFAKRRRIALENTDMNKKWRMYTIIFRKGKLSMIV
jgi:hypothetical protein